MDKLKNSPDQEGTWHTYTYSETGTRERDRDRSARKFEWGEYWRKKKDSARQFSEGNRTEKRHTMRLGECEAQRKGERSLKSRFLWKFLFVIIIVVCSDHLHAY